MEWIKELLKRFLADKPEFFKVLQGILSVTVFIGLVPSALDWLCTNAEICDFLPEKITLLVGKIVAISSSNSNKPLAIFIS